MLRHAGQHAIEAIDRLLPALQSHQADAAVEQHGGIGRRRRHGAVQRRQRRLVPAEDQQRDAAVAERLDAIGLCLHEPLEARQRLLGAPHRQQHLAEAAQRAGIGRLSREHALAQLPRLRQAPLAGMLHRPLQRLRGLDRRGHKPAQSAASAAFFLSVISIEPGLWVMQIDGRAASMTTCGVTPHAQNKGSSPGCMRGASP